MLSNRINANYLTGFLLLCLLMPGALMAKTYKLYVGDIMTLPIGKITRVAVGNGKLMSTSILENGDLLILAEKEGDTDLNIWTNTGQKINHKFFITKSDTQRTAAEVTAALKNIPGISMRQVGENIILEGTTTETTKNMLENVVKKYKEIINLTEQFSMSDINELLAQIPRLKVKKVGKFAVVSGSIDKKGKVALETIKAAFPEILDLTKEDLIADEAMVYMNVQITEFSTNALENLGIDWQTSIGGPSIGYTETFNSAGNDSSLNAFNNQVATPALTSANALAETSRGAFGYFGIATLITSAINLAVSTGDALILASPTLSAKSGGKAKFLSGGEIPIPVPGDNGQTNIEYKEYGIKLDIEPNAGALGNITAKIMTEVSSVDSSVSVNGTPGFKTRTAETEVNLKDGQTLVISGLVNNDISKDIDSVKWMADIPILGELFKSTNFRNKRSDLVIFITPTIYNAESEVNKNAIQRAADLRTKFFDSIEESAEIID